MLLETLFSYTKDASLSEMSRHLSAINMSSWIQLQQGQSRTNSCLFPSLPFWAVDDADDTTVSEPTYRVSPVQIVPWRALLLVVIMIIVVVVVEVVASIVLH